MTACALPLPVPFPALFARREAEAAAATPRAATDPEEAAWVCAARAGDPDAFRRLVDRYRDGVVELAARIVRSPEEAEEAAQDAFVRAWRALPGFRGEARFSTWLHRIAVRRALDAHAVRARRRAREDATDPAAIDATIDVAGDASAGLGDAERRRLLRILGELDPLPRAAVSLFYLGGRSVGEVAEILELPEGTVKTHLHRSRATLRRAWRRESMREERVGLP